MSDYDDEDEIQTIEGRPAIKTFRKKVAASTIKDAVVHLSDWSHSWYDMYLLSVEEYPDREGFVAVSVFGWENGPTRERYPV